MKRFRGGLVFKAHGLLHHSLLGLRVTKKKKRSTHSAITKRCIELLCVEQRFVIFEVLCLEASCVIAVLKKYPVAITVGRSKSYTLMLLENWVNASEAQLVERRLKGPEGRRGGGAGETLLSASEHFFSNNKASY